MTYSLAPAIVVARRAHAGGLSLHHHAIGRHRVMAENLALEDPHLDAADAISGVRLGLGIVDVGAQRMQRHTTLAIALRTCDLGAAETTTAVHLDAVGTQAHRRLHRTLHGTA